MRNKKLIFLLVLLLAVGFIAMAGCGAPPEEDFDMEEDPFADPDAGDDPFDDPDLGDDDDTGGF